MAYIAGHNFNSGPLGNLCSNSKKTSEGVEYTCNKNLVDILNTTKDQIGKHGIACVAQLTETEYNQIEAERERIWGTLKHPTSEAR